MNITSSYETTVNWMMEHEYIPKERMCSTCIHHPMRLASKGAILRWKCNKCSIAASIFEGTIFYNTNKKLCELVDLVYVWCDDTLQGKARRECNTKSRKTVGTWYKKLQKLSYVIMSAERPRKIGGPGHIIEIDESQFSKRKYNVGRTVRKLWVVGGIDVVTKEAFFVEVVRRDAVTLQQVILENVELGSTIYTDCWRGYINLDSLGYIHETVNHATNFVDPQSCANTQLIENTWGVFKRKIRDRHINNPGELSLLFAEFLFKKHYGDACFEMIMKNLINSLNNIDF
jgi:IS1 family transposase